ncbi:39S ribosomal protein L43, mitochondrial [Trichoplax sp. H2]|nr:39S ribosomal protein L43, mitochondrial [Trichoplax sp. H2]|eukprot:RDD40547.1 39S ribosomal protein L43, mitochondrial [Trichoplax sp. H2]
MASTRLTVLTQFVKGRYICQLQRITLRYCNKGGSSRGLREFINSNAVDFAQKNPQVVVYVRPRPYRHPSIIAEFLNGKHKAISVKNLSRAEINNKVEQLRNSSGITRKKMKRWWHTDSPSIQGVWTPFDSLPYKNY